MRGNWSEEGAHILDIGGESTRPGAAPGVRADDELARVLPLIEALRDCGVPLSIDTFKPGVMRAVLDAGADMINDIYGFRQPGAIEAVAGSALRALRHAHEGRARARCRKGRNTATCWAKSALFLGARAQKLRSAWVDPRRIVLDPGFGFGKTPTRTTSCARRLGSLRVSSYPLLVGRVAQIHDRRVPRQRCAHHRLPGSIAAALACVARGAAIVRVHDVAATADALKVWQAVEQGGIPIDVRNPVRATGK